MVYIMKYPSIKRYSSTEGNTSRVIDEKEVSLDEVEGSSKGEERAMIEKGFDNSTGETKKVYEKLHKIVNPTQVQVKK